MSLFDSVSYSSYMNITGGYPAEKNEFVFPNHVEEDIENKALMFPDYSLPVTEKSFNEVVTDNNLLLASYQGYLQQSAAVEANDFTGFDASCYGLALAPSIDQNILQLKLQQSLQSLISTPSSFDDNIEWQVDYPIGTNLLFPGESSSDGEEAEAGLTPDEILQMDPVTTRHRKWPKRMKLIDLRTLLIECAEAAASNNLSTAAELLHQIRQHSSPSGGGLERTAHWFANALEARLAGLRIDSYAVLLSDSWLSAAYFESCSFLISSCPFMKMSIIFVTQTILEKSEQATRLHIIDFGILQGINWPYLIQCLSRRAGGSPVLRITGIGWQGEGVEETGQHLASYCQKFNVPFEYNWISDKWENLQSDDLKIDRNELTVVSCLYRSRYLLDETVVSNSPRDAVLNLIWKLNPDIFIHGIINGAHNGPFFVPRFREALFYFSTIFDMFETNAGCEDQAVRMVFEEGIFGKEILNVIACEGPKRVERPETYKQWHVRNLRAGFRQVPLNQEMMQKLKVLLETHYHKDFSVEQDKQWVLQGWKGRILCALSCWKSI